MIKRVLIANRGAIAVRILRTLRARGLESATWFTREVDHGSGPHVDLADRAISLGEGTLAETPSQWGSLIAIGCLRRQVDAIHPGYGFLL